MGVLTNEITVENRSAANDGPTPGLIILALVLCTLLAVRIVGLALASTDLHSDEAQYWLWAKGLALTDTSRPPVATWLAGLASAICGDSEACIRMPSPIIFTASAFLIYPLARRLYDDRIAFWASIVYATLPAVSTFSMVAMPEAASSLFWIAGLLFTSMHLERATPASGLALGLAIGLGLLTDYSLIYLPLCTVLYLIVTHQARTIHGAPGTWLAVATTIVVVAAYLAWTEQIDAISFRAPAFLSDWTFRHLNPDATLVFIALQFVLFGPILLVVLMRVVLMRPVSLRADSDHFLLFHSVPVFAVLLFQVLFFKASAHWALPAYPAAAIFVTALLLRYGFQRLLMLSIGLHLTIFAGLFGMAIFADRLEELPLFDRMVGWRQFAEELATAAGLSEINTVVLQGNSRVAEAMYYLRDTDIEILAFDPRIRSTENDYDGRQRGWAYGSPETVLLATDRDPSAFGVPLGNANRIGEFPSQAWLSEEGVFALYRVNPPAETPSPAQ